MEDDRAIPRIISVVTGERRARDLGLWDEMLAGFHPDAVVDISWVRASGPEFVELSRRSLEAGVRSVHVLGPVSVECNADRGRALADVGALIEVHAELLGTPCAITAFARLVERLE